MAKEMSVESAEPRMNRWLVVAGAILIQLALGALYSWSVFTPVLNKALSGGGEFGFSAKQTQVIFSVALLVFALVMVIAGRLQKLHGPRKIALAGGTLFGLGYILASFTGASFIGMLVTIGIIGGAGLGLAYVVPIAVGIKWFPDKKGLISGLAVAGFGFGATLWVKLADNWGGLLESYGIHQTFLIYGIVFFLMVTIGALVMVNPPEGYTPKGWQSSKVSAKSMSAGHEFRPGQMLRTRQFYMIWLMFLFGALAGLMVIGVIKLFGIDALQTSGIGYVEASAIAGTAMAVFYSIFNGIGRITWGMVSDKIGYKMALTLMLAFQAVMMFLVFRLGKSEYTFYLAAALIGFNFGGNFALFPIATADLFGSKNVGNNYGYVFSSYGIGGVIGPTLAGYFKDAGAAGDVNAWHPPFIIAGALCLVAVVLASLLKAPDVPSEK